MKAELEIEVVQRRDVVDMIADINEVFRRVEEEEAIDQNGYNSNEYITFRAIRKDIIEVINSHMNDMDKQ